MTDATITAAEGCTVTDSGATGDSELEIEKDDGAIQALSEKLQVPPLKVIEVYRTEFKRLASQSRIATYLGVLALQRTKHILREQGAAALH